ncbi:putative nicotinate-nucleotide adenylyltransferase [Candidatus Electrothrix gigas]
MGEENEKKRIGLFGGTFDPIHKGHLSIAFQAAQEARLDQVLFIPAADPPHKKMPGASYWHRVAMLKAAFAELSVEQDRFVLSLLEAELPFPSYTVDTLLELKKRLLNPRCYFIIGADSLLDLHRWYQYQKLLCLTNFIVVSRPGVSLSAMQRAVKCLPGSFQSNTSNTSNTSHQCWVRSDGAEILLLVNRLKEDISSTMIRAALQQGKIPQDVAPPVREYIAQEGLY